MVALKPLVFELGVLEISTNVSDNINYKGKRLLTEEFTISVATENVQRYACDIIAPIDIAPQKKKFNWTIKRPKFFETDYLFFNAMYSFEFDIKVFRIVNKGEYLGRNKPDYVYPDFPDDLKAHTGEKGINVKRGFLFDARDSGVLMKNEMILEHVMNLRHCLIDSAHIGNFDGTKPVSEDIQGTARFFSFSRNVADWYAERMKVDELNIR